VARSVLAGSSLVNSRVAGGGGMPGVADRGVVVEVLDHGLIAGPGRPADVGLGVGVWNSDASLAWRCRSASRARFVASWGAVPKMPSEGVEPAAGHGGLDQPFRFGLERGAVGEAQAESFAGDLDGGLGVACPLPPPHAVPRSDPSPRRRGDPPTREASRCRAARHRGSESHLVGIQVAPVRGV
jgi:hypothetical protein